MAFQDITNRGRGSCESPTTKKTVNGNVGLRAVLMRSVRKRRKSVRPSTPLSGNQALKESLPRHRKSERKTPVPPDRIRKSRNALWIFDAKKWSRVRNTCCRLVREEARVATRKNVHESNKKFLRVKVDITDYGLIDLGNDSVLLHKRCLVFKSDTDVCAFWVPDEQVVAINDIVAGHYESVALLPVVSKLDENRRQDPKVSLRSKFLSSRTCRLRRNLADKLQNRVCDAEFREGKWTGAALISVLAIAAIVSDVIENMTELWGLPIFLSLGGTTFLYAYSVARFVRFNAFNIRTFVRRAPRATAAFLIGWLLWITKLLAVGKINSVWIRIMRSQDEAEASAEAQISEALGRLKWEDFVPVRCAAEARTRKRGRAHRIVGEFHLHLPRRDLTYDVAFVNKLCALEFVLRDIPSTLLRLYCAVRTEVAFSPVSFVLSVVLLISNGRYTWNIFRERRWASELWGISDYIELCRDFYRRFVAGTSKTFRMVRFESPRDRPAAPAIPRHKRDPTFFAVRNELLGALRKRRLD